MLFLVSDIITVIAEKLDGGGESLCNSTGLIKCLKAYNRINEILMTRQDWPGTETDVAFPVYEGVFTLPARFESIKAIKVNDRALPVVPAGFQYLDTAPRHLHCFRHYGKSLRHLGSHFATFRDPPGAFPVFAVSDATEALTITVQGTDEHGKNRREVIPVTTAYPDRSPVSTRVNFATITAVTKPLTKGHIELIAWDDANGEALWLSSLAPDETTPSLSRWQLIDHHHGHECHIQARVSMAYREQWEPAEVALIQAREPYRLMTQALAHFDRSETGPGAEFQNRAVKLLKERAAKLAVGQEMTIPQRRADLLPSRHGYSIRSWGW